MLALAGALLIVVYLSSRLTVAHGLPYFLDEGLFAGYSYRGAQSAQQLFVSLSIGKEPLQAWLGIVWQWLGANPLNSIRLVSVSAGLLTVGIVALLGRRLGGWAVGLVAAVLSVLLPFMVVNDAVGIEEPLVTLVMATALLLQIDLARVPSLRRGTALGLVLAAGVLSKQSAQAAVALLPASLLMFDFSPAGRRSRILRWLGAVAIAVALPLAAGLVLRASDYWSQGRRFMAAYPLVRSLGRVLGDPFATAAHAWSVFSPALAGYVTLPLLAGLALGVLLGSRRRPRLTALLVIWILAPVAAALTFTVVPYPRHLMYALPPAVVLLAIAVVELATATPPRLGPVAWRATVAVLVILALAPALVFDRRVVADPRTARYPGLDDLQYVTGVPAGGAWPAVATAIRGRSDGRGAVVLVAQADPNVIRFLLSADPASRANRYPVVLPATPAARRARFAIFDQLPFGNPTALRAVHNAHFTVVGRFPRPRGGAIITLYERPG